MAKEAFFAVLTWMCALMSLPIISQMRMLT